MADQAIGFRLAVSGDDQAARAFDRVGESQDRAADAAARLGAAQTRQSGQGRQAVTTADATARALGALTPQLGDLVSQISSGGSAATALIQQGLQLRDVFAQDETALAGLRAMITPTTVALGLLGGTAAALALAYKQGSEEGDAYLRAIVTTGNAAGTSVGQLDAYAATIGRQVGTQHAAAEALAALVSTGRVGSEQLTAAGATALQMERELGVSLNETAKAYADLGRDPVAASLRLNDATNYLTRSTYERIKALQEQGRQDEAAAAAQDAYSTAMSARMRTLEAELGGAQKLWRFLGEEAGKAWDAMLAIGRDTSLQEKINQAADRVAMLQRQQQGNAALVAAGVKMPADNGAELAAAQETLALLQRTKDARDANARAEREVAGETQLAAKYDAEIARLGAAQLPPKERARRIEEEIAKIRADAARLNLADWKVTALIAQAREKWTDKSGDSAAKKEREEQVKLAQQLAGLSESFGEDWDRLSKMRAAGALSTDQLAEAQAKLLGQQPFMRDAAKAQADAAKIAADAATKAYQQQVQTITGLEAELKVQQQHNEAIGLEATALVALAYRRDQAAIALREEAYQIEVMQGATPERLAALRKEIDLQKGLAESRRTGGTKDAAQSALDQLGLGAKDIQQRIDLTSVKDAIQGLDSPLGIVVDRFQAMLDLQRQFGEQARLIAIAKQGDAAQQAKALQAEAQLGARVEQARLSGYASMAGAAKSFFGEGSKGYKALANAEKVFRAVELANAVKTAATQLGLISSVTTAKVASEATKAAAAMTGQATETAAVTAGEAQRNVAKTPGVFMAFMSAMGPWGMAAAAAAVAAVLGGAFSGGSATVDPGNTGAGTVFGDADAQSKSIARSLELLGEVDTKTMNYSAQMAASLHNIESNIGGLTNLLIRSGNLDAAAAGINTGTQTTGLGRAATTATSLLLGGPVGALLGMNKLIGGIAGKLFSSKTTITGQGIYGAPQNLNDILANGFDASYYADVNTRKKAFGITYSNKNRTRYTPADAELERQFQLIFQGFDDAVEAAAGPLGVSLGAVEQRLLGFVVNIGKINLKDLSGAEIQEKLSAVFGAAGDDIAKAALPGLEQYQQVGEGYLEAAVRVSSTTEAVRETLRSLGLTVYSLGEAGTAASMDLVDAFGDLDAFSTQTAAYFEAYYTDAERAANTSRQLTEALARLGINTLPQTRDAYRALVEAQDLTAESGRNTYAALIGLSGLFADLTDAAETAGQSIRDEIQRLRGATDTATAEGIAALEARYAVTLASARAGSTTARDALPGLTQAIEQATASTATSSLDVSRVRARLAADLERLLGVSVPAYAAGGDHPGGLAWVGEEGPELVNLPPSRVYTARDSAQLMRAGAGGADPELLAEVRALRGVMERVLQGQGAGDAAIAGHVAKLVRLIERLTRAGDALAVQVEEATA